MSEVAVLVGLQASGKTTFYRQALAATHAHVSKDLFPRARRRQDRQLRLIAQALEAGMNVAVDNTNPAAPEWEPILAVARGHGARVVAYWFPPDLAASLARNAARQGRQRVPEVGLHAVAGRLTRPRREDGFDEVFTVVADGRGGFAISG